VLQNATKTETLWVSDRNAVTSRLWCCSWVYDTKFTARWMQAFASQSSRLLLLLLITSVLYTFYSVVAADCRLSCDSPPYWVTLFLYNGWTVIENHFSRLYIVAVSFVIIIYRLSVTFLHCALAKLRRSGAAGRSSVCVCLFVCLAVPRPRKGSATGQNFWLRLTTASAQCLRLLRALLHCLCRLLCNLFASSS